MNRIGDILPMDTYDPVLPVDFTAVIDSILAAAAEGTDTDTPTEAVLPFFGRALRALAVSF